MLKVGDTFTQGGFTYKVIDKDAQGRAISALCDNVEPNYEEDIKEEKTPIEEIVKESKKKAK